MRLIYYIFLIVIMFSSALAAEAKDSKYRIIPDKEGNLSVKTSTKELKGKLGERKGIYSRWLFGDAQGQTAEDFVIIVNDKTKKLLNISANAPGGPFISSASPYPHDYVVFDYGTAPTGRSFEIRNAVGKIVFKDNYFTNDLVWLTGNYVIYPQTIGESNKPKDIKKCEKIGRSNMVVWIGYDLKTKKKQELNIPGYMECSN